MLFTFLSNLVSIVAIASTTVSYNSSDLLRCFCKELSFHVPFQELYLNQHLHCAPESFRFSDHTHLLLVFLNPFAFTGFHNGVKEFRFSLIKHWGKLDGRFGKSTLLVLATGIHGTRFNRAPARVNRNCDFPGENLTVFTN